MTAWMKSAIRPLTHMIIPTACVDMPRPSGIAIQTSLFVDVLNAFSAMTDPLSAAIRFRIVRLLLLHWQFAAIVEEIHCCSRTVYSILENLFMYSSPFKSQFRLKEISCKMFKTA